MKKNVLEVNPKLEIGTGDIELYLEVKGLNGEVLVSKKADSLVANFLRFIYSFMSGEVIPDGLTYLRQNTTAGGDDLDETGSTAGNFGGITGVTTGATTVITHPNTGYTSIVGEYVAISGVTGITPDINGVHEIIARTSTTVTINVSTSGTFAAEGARILVLKKIDNNQRRADSEAFNYFTIRVGRDDTANLTDQQWLNNSWDISEGTVGESYELEYGTTVYSTPAFDYTNRSAELSFSSIVTNNSGGDVELNEVGLFTRFKTGGFDNRYCMVARDILPSPIDLTNGTAVTVTYKIVVSSLSTGGFTDYLLSMLMLLIDTSTNRSFTDIEGTTASYGESSGIFLLNAPPGNAFANTSLLGSRGQYVGIQIGTGSTAFAFDDRDMDARIPHGTGTGEMIHYGNVVDNFQVSGANVSFDITKMFENRSGSTISVREFGISAPVNAGSGQFIAPIMLVRNVLPVAADVEDGEAFRVKYTITLTVA
jgi:hypothetical protein